MNVCDVESLTAQKKVLTSHTFTCPDDPHPVSFQLEVGFGSVINGLQMFIMPVNRKTTLRSLKVNVLDKDMFKLLSKSVDKEDLISFQRHAG